MAASASDRRASADLVGQKLRVDGRVGVVVREKKRLGRSTLHIVRFTGDGEEQEQEQELKLNRKGNGGTDFTVLAGTTESGGDDWEQLEALMDDAEHLKPPGAPAAAAVEGDDDVRRMQLLQARLMMLSAGDGGADAAAGVAVGGAGAPTGSGSSGAGSAASASSPTAADGDDAADGAAAARKVSVVGKQAILATLAAHEPLHATVTLVDGAADPAAQAREAAEAAAAADASSAAVRFSCVVRRADGVGESWAVRRRFNDFHELHLSVGAAASSAASASGWGLPAFPSKWRGSAVGRLLSRTSANAQLEQRRTALERYLQALLRCESQLDAAARARVRDFVRAPGAASAPAVASTPAQEK